MWLFVLFLAVPLIEIALFIQVGGFIGLWPTLAIVVMTAVLGTWLMRAQGAMAMGEIRNSLNELRDPTEPLAHGAMILIAAALLLTPGFFTDAVGFSLLVPQIRSAVFRYFRARVKVQSFSMGDNQPHRPYSGETVIDADYEEIDPPKPSGKPGNSGWTKD